MTSPPVNSVWQWQPGGNKKSCITYKEPLVLPSIGNTEGTEHSSEWAVNGVLNGPNYHILVGHGDGRDRTADLDLSILQEGTSCWDSPLARVKQGASKEARWDHEQG